MDLGDILLVVFLGSMALLAVLWAVDRVKSANVKPVRWMSIEAAASIAQTLGQIQPPLTPDEYGAAYDRMFRAVETQEPDVMIYAGGRSLILPIHYQ